MFFEVDADLELTQIPGVPDLPATTWLGDDQGTWPVPFGQQAFGVQQLLRRLRQPLPERQRLAPLRFPQPLHVPRTSQIREYQRLADNRRRLGEARHRGRVKQQARHIRAELGEPLDRSRHTCRLAESVSEHHHSSVSLHGRLRRGPCIVPTLAAEQHIQVRLLILEAVNQLVSQHRVTFFRGDLLANEKHIASGVVVANGLFQQEINQQRSQIHAVRDETERGVSQLEIPEGIAGVFAVEPVDEISLEGRRTRHSDLEFPFSRDARELLDARQQLRHPAIQGGIAPGYRLTA